MAEKKYPFYEAMMKGILGPSIGEANENAATIGDNGQKVGDLSGGSVSHRFAASNGVVISNGKFKCPPGTPGAGDFTDALGSTCGNVSESGEVKGIAANIGMMSAGRSLSRAGRRGGGMGAAVRSVAPDPDARDADGDGMVQEGTSAARRVAKNDLKKYGGWNLPDFKPQRGEGPGSPQWDALAEKASGMSDRQLRNEIDRSMRASARGSGRTPLSVHVHKAEIDKREAAKAAQKAKKRGSGVIGDGNTVGQIVGKESDQELSEKSESTGFREGSFVRWDSSGGEAQGQIEHVMTDGTLGIPGSKFKIDAKPGDPAVLIRIWKKNVDGWAATETLVGHKASTLSPIESLKSDNGISEKVGLMGSHSKPLQAIGAGVSAAVPGDSADVRSPVRSTIAEIVTPGGNDHHLPGRRPRIGGGQDHCPPGFEFGGRFTNARLSTCGIRLFDVPAFQGSGQAVAGDVAKLNNADNPLTGTLIAASKPGKITAIQRRAEIAVVGDLNVTQMEASVANSIPIIASSEKTPTRLIRRDGTILDATVPIARLAKTRNNADMKDGVIITRVAQGANLGQNEVSLLGAGARAAVMVFPDGSSLRLSRADNTSSEAIRGLGRKWAAVQKSTPVDEYGSALEKLVDASNGKLTLTPDIKNVKGPIQMIRIQREDGSQRMVRRWIFEIFLSSSAPARGKDTKPWTVVPSSKSLRTNEPEPPVKKKFLNSL